MEIFLKAEGFKNHAALFKKTLERRLNVTYAQDGMTVEFAVDTALGAAESYRICAVDGGWRITGSDELGLYFGIGKFLHTANWEEDTFIPAPPEGIHTPDCSLRAMYFPLHHFQWFHMAPVEEVVDYMEDMLLWGYNTIIFLSSGINSDGAEDPQFRKDVKKIRRVCEQMNVYGMRKGVIIPPNQGFKNAPQELNSTPGENLMLRGNSGRNICPAKPGAHAYLKMCWKTGTFDLFGPVGLDYIVTWPYDEGGCGCERCKSWGANGYLDICKVLRDEARKAFPDVKIIISTWAFDDPEDEGEYAGLYARLTGDMAWVDYLMVDAHREFPEYPLEHPALKPIINFPEISMWGLNPWGGYGANPLPKRFQSIWNSSKHILQGGLPYAEGIFEDIHKILWSGFYWEKDKNYRDILSEYIGYEYPGADCGDVLAIMEGIEENHTRVAKVCEPVLETALRTEALAQQVNRSLSEKVKACWRWRILYIRAVLDLKRYRYFYENDQQGMDGQIQLRYYSGNFLKEDQEAQAMLQELVELYHMDPANKNKSTLPPVGGSNYVIANIEKYLLEKIY